MPAPARPQDRILTGIALMLAFCVLAPLLDTCAKLATASIPVGQITTARFLVQSALMIVVALMMRLSWRVTPRVLALLALRAVLLILSTYAFIAGVKYMPLADTLAIVFVEPFILLILGHLIFGDHIGPRRIAASVTGFGGAMLVIQPALAHFGLVALFPLATAFLFAAYMLVTRAISAHIHAVTQQLHTSLIGLAICLPLSWLSFGAGIPSLETVMPQGWVWLWLFGVGFWAAASHMCMTLALQYAPPSTLAPLHYLELVTAVILGYLVFGDFPNPLTWAGIAVIAGSGLYVIHRERLTANAARAALPPTR